MKRRSGVTAVTSPETDGIRPCWLSCMRRMLKHHVPAIAPATRARSLTIQTAQKAKQAKLELLVIVPLMAITVTAYVKREELFGADTPVRLAAAIAMVALGWLLARDLGRFAAPRAVPAHGSRDGRHDLVPDPAGDDRGRGAAVAAGRRPGPGHAGRRRCHHRGGDRPRGPADARQPDRRHGADRGAPVPGR